MAADNQDTSTQDRQWADHLRDEAHALQGQQVTAGSSHSPTTRIQPYTEQNLREEILRAVQAERARCEAIARSWAEPGRLAPDFTGLDEQQLRVQRAVAAGIAQDIATLDGGAG